jgi:NADH-quinone oxidoreductase subunit F
MRLEKELIMTTVTKNITSLADLDAIKSSYQKEDNSKKFQLLVCAGAGCISSGCHAVRDSLLKSLEAAGLLDQVVIHETGCIGTCDLGPSLVVQPDDVFYTKLKPEDMPNIVNQHLVNGNIIDALCYLDRKTDERVTHLSDIEYFKRQVRLVTARCGSMPYNDIQAYIASDGYYGLAKSLLQMSQVDVINEMKKSGLRGRGGGGFPTGIKWEAGYKAVGDEKVVVCNGDEGDPGAFMDRSLMEGDPHAVIEGMLICGYAIGANMGYIYVRAEYPTAIERMQESIKQAHECGLLGKNVMGTSFAFDIEIRIGAGAFVCGEETALMASIEGHRGEPRQKPPFPFERGVFGKPTIINNVETLANVPLIINKSADWFTGYGTPNSRGTKVFALAGDVVNTGIVEVPMGTTLGEIIFDIGGGMQNGKEFKAAQTGGPSGGCLTKEHLNTPVDYDSLVKLGTIMGSGGLIAMDEDTCMVDVARFFMDFVQDESCGKCVPCRIGTRRMLEILERITQGKGKESDIELLKELAVTCKETSTCGLGQTAGNPVLSTIRYFREEFEEHIKQKYCRGGICAELFISPCQNACPAGVNVPGYVALIAAGRPRDAYNLIRKDNPFPAICGRVCTHPCESKCRRAQVDESLAICDLKRYASDFVFNNDEPYMDLVFPKKDESIGIIGAGPSGLTCAYYLARLGYGVTVYEMQPIAGGMLAYGIPEYRLPNDILEKEIRLIEQVGVEIKLGVEVGKDILFSEMRQKHNAIYVATGTQFPNKVGVPGEELAGVYHGLDFLRDVALGKPVTVGKNVVVIGGGSTAFDAARTALRKGAESVTVIYRRTIEDMPADQREIDEAIEEGVEVRELLAPVAIVGDKNVTGIRCIAMELRGFDGAGRRKPYPVEGLEVVIAADMVIPAVSQHSDLPFISKDDIEVSQWGTLVTDPETMMTSIDGVFAGGDVIRGPDIVITAIADGKKTASAISRYLGGDGELNTGEDIDIPMPEAEEEVMEHDRFEMRYNDPEQRIKNFDEVVVGFHRLNAIAEAMRCLRCDRRC